MTMYNSLLVMVLPCAMLKGSLMRTSQKLELAFVFSLVLLTISFTIVRTVFAMQSQSSTQDHVVFGIMEPQVAVIVCALPCYRGILLGSLSSNFNASLQWVQGLFARSSQNVLEAPSESDLCWARNKSNAVRRVVGIEGRC